MAQILNARQHVVYGEFLQKLAGGMNSEQYQRVKSAIDGWDLERLVSAIDSINFSAPEARIEPTKNVYYGLGLRDLLKEVGLTNEERRGVINRIAGEEVAHRPTGAEREQF